MASKPPPAEPPPSKPVRTERPPRQAPPPDLPPFAPASNREPVDRDPARPVAPRAPVRRKADPWSRLKEAFVAIGGPVAALAEGRPMLDKGRLTIGLPGGRVLADGRRALRNPAVAEAVTRCYPDRTEVEVVPLPGTGTQKDVQDALERRVLQDPDMQRILQVLDATLTRVVPLTDGD